MKEHDAIEGSFDEVDDEVSDDFSPFDNNCK